MKNPPPLLCAAAALALFVFAAGHVWLMTAVKAVPQAGCNGPHPFNPPDAYWPKNAEVTVKFQQGHFTTNQRDTMRQAFET